MYQELHRYWIILEAVWGLEKGQCGFHGCLGLSYCWERLFGMQSKIFNGWAHIASKAAVRKEAVGEILL